MPTDYFFLVNAIADDDLKTLEEWFNHPQRPLTELSVLQSFRFLYDEDGKLKRYNNLLEFSEHHAKTAVLNFIECYWFRYHSLRNNPHQNLQEIKPHNNEVKLLITLEHAYGYFTAANLLKTDKQLRHDHFKKLYKALTQQDEQAISALHEEARIQFRATHYLLWSGSNHYLQLIEKLVAVATTCSPEQKNNVYAIFNNLLKSRRSPLIRVTLAPQLDVETQAALEAGHNAVFEL